LYRSRRPLIFEFSCDPAKNEETIRKRGIDLLKAGELLYQAHIDLEDDREDYSEERRIAKGYLNGVPLVIIYTSRGPNRIHVISARKLKRTEELALVKELNLEATKE
jgi:uncharacterized DUF497 family protein